MLSDVCLARTNAAMLLMLIATTSSRTCTKPNVNCCIVYNVDLECGFLSKHKRVEERKYSQGLNKEYLSDSKCILIYKILSLGKKSCNLKLSV